MQLALLYRSHSRRSARQDPARWGAYLTAARPGRVHLACRTAPHKQTALPSGGKFDAIGSLALWFLCLAGTGCPCRVVEGVVQMFGGHLESTSPGVPGIRSSCSASPSMVESWMRRPSGGSSACRPALRVRHVADLVNRELEPCGFFGVSVQSTAVQRPIRFPQHPVQVAYRHRWSGGSGWQR